MANVPDEVEEKPIIPAGSVFTIASGGYADDFAYLGPFRALADIDKGSAVEEFRAGGGRSVDAFVEHLTKLGFVEDMEAEEWYLGDYGDIWA